MLHANLVAGDGQTAGNQGGFTPDYPGQPESGTILWGESIRVEDGTIRPNNPLVRLFGVPGEWGAGGPLNGAQVVADVTFDVTADSGSEAEIMFDLTRTFAILAGTGQAVSTSNSRYTV